MTILILMTLMKKKKGEHDNTNDDDDDDDDDSHDEEYQLILQVPSLKRQGLEEDAYIPRMIPVSSSSSTAGFKPRKYDGVDNDDDDKYVNSKKKRRRTTATDDDNSGKDSRDVEFFVRTMNQHQHQQYCIDNDNDNYEYDSSYDEAVERGMNQRIKKENYDDHVLLQYKKN
jgi:hypothetical protein